MKKSSLFQNMPIQYKIIGLFIPLILVPLVILGYVSNRISTHAIIQTTITNTLNESVLISNQIDSILDIAEDRADVIVRNLNIIYDQYSTSSSDIDQDTQALDDRIMSELVFALSSEIDSLTYIDQNNNVYCTNRITQKQKKMIVNSSYLEVMETASNNNNWFPMKPSSTVLGIPDEPVVIMGKNVIDTLSAQSLGVLFIGVKEKTINEVYHNFNTPNLERSYIISNLGMVISSNNKRELFRRVDSDELVMIDTKDIGSDRSFTGSYKDKLISVVTIPRLGGKLVHEIPLSYVTDDAEKVTAIIIIVGILCLIAALIASKSLTDIIVKPVLLLVDKMKQLQEGNFDVQLHLDSSDEIGLLTKGFDTMSAKIKDLLRAIEKEQQTKREYELALLQAQIKPHFLYNTLYLVYIFCKNEKYHEGMQATKSLSDFYKAVLSNGKEVISIHEELQNVMSYLEIQRIRYSDIFDYQINIDENIMTGKIPKLTIQPLVENAIYHGLKSSKCFGLLKIDGYIDEDMIILQVIDNGVGINKDILGNLFVTQNKEFKHFGLRNVNERIKLYYGTDFGLEVTSEINKRTTVTVKLPLI